MTDNVLIVKKDKSKMTATLRRRANRSFAPDDYLKVINPKDYNDLALLFEDLELVIGAPVEKAFRVYKEKKDRFPFF